MGSIGNMVYDMIVWSGLTNFLMDYIKPIIERVVGFQPPAHDSNYEVTDAKGKKIRLCKANGTLYPPFGERNFTEVLPNIPVRPDDILLGGYPKTGCHWTYEILYMLRNNKAKLSQHGKMIGMLEAVPQIITDSLRSPRVLNSHVNYDALPKDVRKMKTKIILTMRNPKDTVVSFYNHTMNLKLHYGYEGEFEDYFKLFMEGMLDYGDYFDYWLDWEQVMKAHPTHPILVVPFEDLKADTVKTIIKIADFLETPITKQFAEEVAQACEFNKLKKKRSGENAIVAGMFRKGKIGDWRNWLTDDMSDAIEKRWKEKMIDCTYQPTL